ncbi:hypothetical protein BDW67DRAFT_181489 [Aspergillus spinulosporus]
MDCIEHITARKVLFRGGESASPLSPDQVKLVLIGSIRSWPGAWHTRTSKSAALAHEANSDINTNDTGGLTYASIEQHSYAETTEFYGWLDRNPLHPGTNTTRNTNVDSLSSYAYMESSLDNGNFTQSWDLSGYDAIELVLGKSDGKTYTLALEDDRSFLSWEAQFRCINEKGLMTATREVLRFRDLVPQRRRTSTFMSARPRELDLQKVRRFGIGIYR